MTTSSLLLDLFIGVHEFQGSGYCGPTCVRMALMAASKLQNKGFNIPSQEEIAQKTFSGPVLVDGPRKGQKSYCMPEDISKFIGSGAEYKQNLKLKDIKSALAKNKPLIVLWQDNLPDKDYFVESSHYSIIVDLDLDRKTLTIVDPSNAQRLYDKNNKVFTTPPNSANPNWQTRAWYEIDIDEFTDRWYDVIEERGEVLKSNAIILDLNNLTSVQ